MLPSRDQELQASFCFLNRKELDWALLALNRFSFDCSIASAEEEDFYLFLDAFQAFCLSL
jgi:hypothetical protein